MTPVLTVNSLKKHFPIRRGVLGRIAGHVKAVDDVTFAIGKGETLSLVGESGCGKTTTSKMIMRSVTPDSGSILFKGENISGMQPRDLLARGICYVPQGRNIFQRLVEQKTLFVRDAAFARAVHGRVLVNCAYVPKRVASASGNRTVSVPVLRM